MTVCSPTDAHSVFRGRVLKPELPLPTLKASTSTMVSEVWFSTSILPTASSTGILSESLTFISQLPERRVDSGDP
jgi:hypothetical protein